MAASATTAAVMEAAEKEVAVKVGWLECSMPSSRATGGEGSSHTRFHLSHRVALSRRRSWLPPLGTS